MSNYHKYLTNLGYLLRLDRLSDEEIKKVKKDLTFEPIVMKAFKTMIKPSKFLTFKTSPNYLFVPRFYGINTFGPALKNAIPPGDNMNETCLIKTPYAPQAHQLVAYEATQNQFKNIGGGILSVFCGWGKTFLAIYLAVEMRGKTLVLVHKEDLVQQWKDEITKFTNGTAKIGIIQQSKIEIDGCDFVLALIPSLSKREYDKSTFSSFRLLIVDECHHVGSEVFSKALEKVCFKYTLGLSATPDRKDGLTQVFTNYLGPVFHIEKRKERDDTLVLRQPLRSNSSYYSEQYFANGTKNTGKMIIQLVDFDARNNFIMHLLSLLYNEDYSPEPRKTLILSKCRKHLTLIYQALESSALQFESKRPDARRPLTFGYYWGLNPNGENGTTEYCEAPIPKLVQRKKQLKFDLSDKQRCIFTIKKGSISSRYCEYHQYLQEDSQKFLALTGFLPVIHQYVLCQNSDCSNFTLQLGTEGPIKCTVCRGEYQVPDNLSLLETLKSANIKVSNKQKHRDMLNESRTCDIILGTNDICSEGFSVESLNTLISLTPQQEVEQTVGRILRKQGANTLNGPLIIDLIDHCGNFINHSRVRNKIYSNEGFRVVNLPAVNLDDNPLQNFRPELFHFHVKQQSYGVGDDRIDESMVEEDAAIDEQQKPQNVLTKKSKAKKQLNNIDNPDGDDVTPLVCLI